MIVELTLDQALQKGIEAHKAGKVEEADQYYTAILKANPKHPDANHNMGVLAVGVGKVEQALPFFKTALEVNQTIAQFWLSYIDALIKLDRIEDAKGVFAQSQSKGLQGEGFDQLDKRINATDTKKPNSQEPSQEQLQSLVSLYTQGQHQQSLTQASQLLKQFPNSLNLYNIIGASHKGLGELEKAVEAYTKAISLKPDHAETYNNMGNALREQEKLEEAKEAYKKALCIKPDYAEAHYNMGIALDDQGKLEEAIQAYTKALSIKPDYAEAYNNMGNALREQEKLEEATEAYKKAISILPDYAEAYNNLGNVLQEQGKLEEAIEAYTKALSIKPDYAEAYNNTGIALQDQGKLEEAIEAYAKALSIRPDYSKAIVDASSLRNQISETALINEEFEKRLENHDHELLARPIFQINQAVRAFLVSDQKLARKHLNSYSSCPPSSITKLKAMDRVFCSAYNSFLQKLIQTPFENEATFADGQTVYHIESHCLSYAHRLIKIHGMNYTVTPRITFGGKLIISRQKKRMPLRQLQKLTFIAFLIVPKFLFLLARLIVGKMKALFLLPQSIKSQLPI